LAVDCFNPWWRQNLIVVASALRADFEPQARYYNKSVTAIPSHLISRRQPTCTENAELQVARGNFTLAA
jgi:hypothetical protein